MLYTSLIATQNIQSPLRRFNRIRMYFPCSPPSTELPELIPLPLKPKYYDFQFDYVKILSVL